MPAIHLLVMADNFYFRRDTMETISKGNKKLAVTCYIAGEEGNRKQMCETPRQNAPIKMTYTVPEVVVMLGIGKNKAYELCNSGQFKVIRVGKSLRIMKQSFDTWLNGEN
jgi:excisionase family DNA binding protein